VPVLGDIPLLGVLFRSRSKTTERKELLIFLTPQVVLNVTNLAQVRRIDMKTLTEEQLKGSRIQSDIQHDDLQKRILEPIFPDLNTNGPASKPAPAPSPLPSPEQPGQPL